MSPIHTFPICFWAGAVPGAANFVYGNALTSNAIVRTDGRTGIASIWWKWATDGTLVQTFHNNTVDLGTSTVDLTINSSFKLELRIERTNGTVAVLLRSNSSLSQDDLWHHGLIAWDVASAGSARLYIDDVDELNEITYTNATLNYGSLTGATYKIADEFGGCLTEYYIQFNEYLDFNIEANRRKFIDGSGLPADLGSDGSTPTGSQPFIYNTGGGTDFKIGLGQVTSFSGVTPSNCVDSPS